MANGQFGAGDPARNTHRSSAQVKADQDTRRAAAVAEEVVKVRRERRAI